MVKVSYNKLKEWLNRWNVNHPEASVTLSCYSGYYHITFDLTGERIVDEKYPGKCWEVFNVWRDGYLKGRNRKDIEYIIVGDTDKYDECLITPCGSSFERAIERLEELLVNPDENDKILKEGHRNLRIKTVQKKDCWWNDPVMCN